MAERKHEQIAADLRALISSGELRDGDRLPGENALMEQYGVARMTARQALADLQNEGIAVARKGAGVYVRTFRPVRRHGTRRLGKDVWGAGRSMWDVDDSAPVEVADLAIREEPASAEVAHLLDLDEGTPVIARDRRYLVDGRPVQHSISYVPASIAAGTRIVEPDTGPGGVYARLTDLGHEPVRFTEELHARMPTPAETALLALAPGTPVIDLTRIAFTSDNHPIEASRMTLDATAYVLHQEIGP